MKRLIALLISLGKLQFALCLDHLLVVSLRLLLCSLNIFPLYIIRESLKSQFWEIGCYLPSIVELSQNAAMFTLTNAFVYFMKSMHV